MSTSVVRNRWAAGAAARLAWVSIPDPQVIEAVASSGAFDAVVLDLQHSPFDRAAAIAAIRTAAPHPVSVLARHNLEWR